MIWMRWKPRHPWAKLVQVPIV